MYNKQDLNKQDLNKQDLNVEEEILPNEMLFNIFSFLEPEDVINFSSTSSGLYLDLKDEAWEKS